jgi:Peptidase family M28/PDZ domain/PA domain
MRSTRLLASRLLLPALGLVVLAVATLRLPADTRPKTESRLLDDIKYLASDELEGRGIGTEGLNKAALFMRRQFQEAGLDVTRVHGGAFQPFKMSTKAVLGSPNAVRFTGPDGKIIELKQDVGFRPCSFGGSGKISGEIVFAGYGIDAPEKHYRDLAGVDVKGKVVVIMRRVPGQDDPHGAFSAPHGDISRNGDLRSKLSNAIAAGATAVLIVNDPYSVRKNAKDGEARLRKATARVVEAAEALDAVQTKADKEAHAPKPTTTTSDLLQATDQAIKTLREEVTKLKKIRASAEKEENDAFMDFGYGGNGNAGSIPVVQLKIAAIDRVLKPALGKTLTELEAAIDQDLKPQTALVKGWKIDGLTTIDRTPTEVKNVIGVLEGEGPHADETVVVGAHYDHLGRGGEGSLSPGSHEIHNGADDNASGSVSIIELARRFAHRPKKLPRRLVFIAFTGEEEGLFGSAHYVKDPVFPLDKTIAMINLDMVGRLRDDKLTVFGVGTSDRWKNLLEQAAPAHHLHLILKPEGFGPSDQSSFYAKKIPVLHFFTGSHADYHRPTDDWQKINIEGMDRVCDLIEQVVVATDENPTPPDYLEVKGKAAIERSGSRPYFGSIPDFSNEETGYSITGVAPGSPADLGGLKGGDRIIEFGERKITGLDDFDLALRRFAPGDDVAVTAIRNGKPVHLKVTLGKPK